MTNDLLWLNSIPKVENIASTGTTNILFCCHAKRTLIARKKCQMMLKSAPQSTLQPVAKSVASQCSHLKSGWFKI
jgi:hypothetical protein